MSGFRATEVLLACSTRQAPLLLPLDHQCITQRYNIGVDPTLFICIVHSCRQHCGFPIDPLEVLQPTGHYVLILLQIALASPLTCLHKCVILLMMATGHACSSIDET